MEQEYGAVLELNDIIKKKQDIIDKLTSASKAQVICFQEETLDEETYQRMEAKKDKYIAAINRLNTQFDTQYSLAKQQMEQLIQAKNPIAEEIHKQSRLLKQSSLNLQETEKKVQEQLMLYLNRERRKLKEKRMQKKTAATYYKTMTKQMDMMSYFYDRTK